MGSKIFIIIILLVIVLATIFSITGVAKEIKLNQFNQFTETAMQTDTVTQTMESVRETSQKVDKTRDIEPMFIAIIIGVQILFLVIYIVKEKTSFLYVLFIIAVTLLPIQYVYALGPNNKVEKHHINLYHMEYVEGDNSRFNFESELYPKQTTTNKQ